MTAHPSEVLLKIVDREVDVVRIRVRVPRITVRTRIETSENALTTTEVMPPGRDASPRGVQDRNVIGSSLIDVGNWHNNAEKLS